MYTMLFILKDLQALKSHKYSTSKMEHLLEVEQLASCACYLVKITEVILISAVITEDH